MHRLFSLILLSSITFSLTACSQVRLTPEAREQTCIEYGHKKGTPEFGECMQKERQLAQDFWWGE
jgi:hypothetical protein